MECAQGYVLYYSLPPLLFAVSTECIDTQHYEKFVNGRINLELFWNFSTNKEIILSTFHSALLFVTFKEYKFNSLTECCFQFDTFTLFSELKDAAK